MPWILGFFWGGTMNNMDLKRKDIQEMHKKSAVIITFIISFAYILSLIIWKFLWVGNEHLIHSLMGLTCVFVGISTFLLSWNTYDYENLSNRMIGFGFLIISSFDLLHIYYYEDVYKYSNFPNDLTLKFWMMSRVTQGLILFILSFLLELQQSVKCSCLAKLSKRQTNPNKGKYISAILSMGFVLAIWYLFYNKSFFTLYTGNRGTSTKFILEITVIALLIFTLIKLHKNKALDERLSLKYIFLSLCVMIVNEVIFISMNSTNSFLMLYGHVIKIASYHFLYRGIFESAVKYPHRKVEEVNDKLIDILDAIPIALVTYDESNKLSFANKKFQEVIGWSRDELVGLSPEEFFKVIPKDEKNEEQAIVEQVLENESNINGVIRTYRNSKGNNVKLLVNAHRINSGALVFFNDVKAEQQIANLNLQTQTILNSIGIPSVILDNKNRITAYNMAFTNLIHREDIDIIKMSIDELIEMLNGKKKLLDSKYENNMLVEELYEGFFDCENELRKNILIKVSMIYNIEKEKVGGACIIHDITNEKENRQKLINQEKLALLGQMSATIVHETRNFLTTIKGCSQLIQAYSKEEKIKEYAEKINSNTNEVNKIISNLLTMSKPSQAVMEEVSINDLIVSLKSTLETSTITKGIEVNFNLNYDERYILCDEGQLKQVMLNLCKNAVDAMCGNGEAVLNIEIGLKEENEELFIKISDNGVGISKNNLSKIGMPFFTTKKNGTGLGLNACYEIIKNHKGKINVESEIDKGTIFTIVIPCITHEDLAEII